ncbi:MAG: PilZ domain-containing protein [Phycisphaera sp.]|nr:MAG: PilZ domain-containing protein [Phycisphaera sp.]
MLPTPSAISIADDRRDAGRIQCQELRSNVGEIVDASSTGLRIKGKLPSGSRPMSTVMINVSSDDQVLSLNCEIRWIKKQAFRGTTFGVAFLDISEDQRRQLWQMIRTGNVVTNCSRMINAA